MTDEIIYSRLCRTITQDGISVEVHIYRGPETDGWILEVEDDQGTSTVWSETFRSDRAALDEVRRTIDEEGLGVFSGATG